ncbi:3'-5' exonuclease [Clostridium sp. 'White wine YQ']|uniref:3'-5' exonuclease n=1 Tax=Clostridium sp. 'White wine YQ' TaxID=3027474 RepID=UPI0023664FEC|nr:3'-5' exonuclease [Clostridium sp. 'White wine YQ']MDD7794902.1 exonuclease domain-containing protein [Clostridium sp. 'White wine YQ']
MGFVIIDLEFNNLGEISKYFPNFYEENKDIRNLEIDNEIIEIGAVKLDKFMQKTEELKLYIKPTAFKILNPKITEITGIQEEDINEGVGYFEAMDRLRAFIGKDDIICSWAKNDIAEIIINSNFHGYKEISWLKEYLDIQEYCTKVLAHKKSISLKNALLELKIQVSDDNKLHDALNDADYTSKVFKRIYNPRIIKNYIVYDIFNMPALVIKNLEAFKIDYNRVNMTCPRCKNPMELEQPFKLFYWRFMGIDSCKKCRCKILHEVIIKKTFTGKEVYNEIKTPLNQMEYMDVSYKFQKVN